MIIVAYVYISRDALKEDVAIEDAIVGTTIEEQGGEVTKEAVIEVVQEEPVSEEQGGEEK